jgi:hypothetical protein
MPESDIEFEEFECSIIDADSEKRYMGNWLQELTKSDWL